MTYLDNWFMTHEGVLKTAPGEASRSDNKKNKNLQKYLEVTRFHNSINSRPGTDRRCSTYTVSVYNY